MIISIYKKWWGYKDRKNFSSRLNNSYSKPKPSIYETVYFKLRNHVPTSTKLCTYIYEIIYLLFVSAWNSVSYRVTKKNNKISMLKVKHRKNSVMRYISDVYKNKVNSFVYIYIVFITYCFKGSSYICNVCKWLEWIQ